jgi:hypothetical protein
MARFARKKISGCGSVFGASPEKRNNPLLFLRAQRAIKPFLKPFLKPFCLFQSEIVQQYYAYRLVTRNALKTKCQEGVFCLAVRNFGLKIA